MMKQVVDHFKDFGVEEVGIMQEIGGMTCVIHLIIG